MKIVRVELSVEIMEVSYKNCQTYKNRYKSMQNCKTLWKRMCIIIC